MFRSISFSGFLSPHCHLSVCDSALHLWLRSSTRADWCRSESGEIPKLLLASEVHWLRDSARHGRTGWRGNTRTQRKLQKRGGRHHLMTTVTSIEKKSTEFWLQVLFQKVQPRGSRWIIQGRCLIFCLYLDFLDFKKSTNYIKYIDCDAKCPKCPCTVWKEIATGFSMLTEQLSCPSFI